MHKCSLAVWFQFLATLKIMDYSLLVGIHDVDRAEQEEMDVEGVGEEDEYENDGMGGAVLTGSFGTPPDSPGNPLNCGGFFGPGEFDSSVDVYAIKSHDGEESLDSRPSQPRASAVSNGAKRAVFAPGAVKKEVYFMAIIDILTHYDAKKKAAHAAKTVKHGVSSRHTPPPHLPRTTPGLCPVHHLLLLPQAGAEISTVNPEQYSKRFYEFMSNILS